MILLSYIKGIITLYHHLYNLLCSSAKVSSIDLSYILMGDLAKRCCQELVHTVSIFINQHVEWPDHTGCRQLLTYLCQRTALCVASPSAFALPFHVYILSFFLIVLSFFMEKNLAPSAQLKKNCNKRFDRFYKWLLYRLVQE